MTLEPWITNTIQLALLGVGSWLGKSVVSLVKELRELTPEVRRLTTRMAEHDKDIPELKSTQKLHDYRLSELEKFKQ